jgi:hypothetical protein
VTITWWPTTWGRLAPGDLIQAPDGSAWTVGPALVSDGAGEWCISSERGTAWTPHREDEPVSAARPAVDAQHASLLALASDPEVILGRLRLAFGEVEAVPLNDTGVRTGVKWLGCGRERCVCR